MKHAALVVSLAALTATSVAGCKSTPKLAWWKSDKTAESTAMAHSAPQLPSDLAKQSQGQAGAAQVADAGGAPPFVAGQGAKAPATAAKAGNYPSTDAPAFSAGTAGQVAGAASASQPASSANLGALAMPYNPTAPPTTRSAATSALGNVAASAAIPYGQAPSGAAPAFNAAAGSLDTTMAATTSAAAGVAGRYGAAVSSAATVPPGLPTLPAIGAAASTSVQQASAAPYGVGRYGVAASAAPAAASTAAAPCGLAGDRRRLRSAVPSGRHEHVCHDGRRADGRHATGHGGRFDASRGDNAECRRNHAGGSTGDECSVLVTGTSPFKPWACAQAGRARFRYP